MTTMNLSNLRKEFREFLRNGDILTTSVRGVTTKTDSFTATAGQTAFTLTQTGIKNIRLLTVNAASKTYIKDYTWTGAGVVTLTTASTIGDAVSIQYDYGSPDKIFPDNARDDLQLNSFPRVAISIVSSTSQPFQLGGGRHISEVMVTVYAYVPVKKESTIAGGIGGMDDLNDLITRIRNVIRTKEKSFITAPFVTPMGVSPAIPGTNNAILQMSADFNCKFIIE